MRPPDDLVCSPASTWWASVERSLCSQSSETLVKLESSLSEAHVCPSCGVSYSTRSALKTHIAKQHADACHAQTVAPRFSKPQDSCEGLPQCRHCKKCFPTWQLLARHIEGNHCPCKPEAAPTASHLSLTAAGPQAVAGVKLMHHPDMLRLLDAHGVNFVMKVPARSQYLQRCLLRGQWLASPKVVKLHYKGSHPEIFQYNAAALSQSKRFPGSGSPCIYCSSQPKQPRHHKLQCSVLWQFCLAATGYSASAFQLDDHSGPAACGDLRGPGGHSSGGLRSCTDGECHPRPGPAKSAEQGRQARRGGEETEAKRRQSSLLLLWKPSGQGKQRPEPQAGTGLDQSHGTPHPETGNQYSGPQAELCLGPVPAAWTSGSHTNAFQGLDDVQGGIKEQTHGSALTCPASEHSVPDRSSVHSSGGHPPRADEGSTGQGLDEPGGKVDLSALGPLDSGLDRGREPSTDGTSRTGRAPGGLGDGGQSQGRDSSVQRHAPNHTRPEGNLEVSAGSWPKGAGCCGGLAGLGEASESCSITGSRHAATTRWTPALQFGSGHSEDAGRLLSLALNNPNQQCYINSFAMSWLWTHCLLQAPDAQLFGHHQQAWRDILYGPTHNTITRLASWRRLLRNWSRPASQHDVAEFVLHVLSQQQPLALQGQWQSRIAVGTDHVAISDEGSLLSPIILHLRGDAQADTLQACIDRWHQQVPLHGLLDDTPVLLLQLARYSNGVAGTEKDRTEVQLSQKISVPIFGQGLRTYRATYLVSAIILHHGDSLHSGHYTSMLLEPSALPRGSCWGTDDHRSARQYPRLPKCVARDSYLAILARCRFC